MNKIIDVFIIFFIVFAGCLFAQQEPQVNDPNTTRQTEPEPSLRIKPTKSFIENRPPARQVKRPAAIRDGFILYGDYGTIQKTEQGLIFLNQNVIDDTRVKLKEQTPLELLNSSTLAAMERFYEIEFLQKQSTEDADPENLPKAPIRLWARVTRFNGKNYLFPMHFIPLQSTEIQPAQPAEQTDTGENTIETEGETTEEPQNDEDSILPPEVLEKLKPKRVVNLALMREYLEKENDVLLVHRSGFLEQQDGNWIFRIDGFGTKIEHLTFDLLPCQTLQNARRIIEAGRFRQRYNISGIVTRYNNKDYLLLQLAERTYTHGNFSQ